MIRRPPRSTPFPTRRSSDLRPADPATDEIRAGNQPQDREGARPASASDAPGASRRGEDRKSTRLNSSHANISYAVFCLKKKKKITCWRKTTRQQSSAHRSEERDNVEIKQYNIFIDYGIVYSFFF